jgi:hypothetical protein
MTQNGIIMQANGGRVGSTIMCVTKGRCDDAEWHYNTSKQEESQWHYNVST